MEKDIEPNVITSFRLVKSDVIRLQDEFMELRRMQAKILARLSRFENINFKSNVPQVVKIVEKSKPNTKKKVTRSKAVKQVYLASKDGKKFHDPGCNSLKKVSRKNLISYPTKNKAISKGLQPCGMCIPL